MATTRRISRHEMRHDEFVDTMGQFSLWVEKNWQQVGAIAGGVVLLIVVIFGVSTWVSHARANATERLARATALLNAPILAAGANPSDPIAPSFPNRAARAQASLTALDAANPSSAARPLAEYFRGVALLQLDKAAEAEAAFQKAADSADQALLKGLARQGLAAAAEKKGDLAGAEQKLRTLADSPEGYPKDLVLYELSRVQTQAGRPADANQTLQQLAKEFPDSPLAAESRAVTPAAASQRQP